MKNITNTYFNELSNFDKASYIVRLIFLLITTTIFTYLLIPLITKELLIYLSVLIVTNIIFYKENSKLDSIKRMNKNSIKTIPIHRKEETIQGTLVE